MIAVTETKIQAGIDPSFDPSLTGYEHEQTPTECAKGGALLYIKNNLNCKRREDLQEGKQNKIYASIYRHPSMDLEDFTKNYFEKLIEKLVSEKKITYLLGDFNIDLLKIETDLKICNFYNILTSNLFVPHITLPTRITSHSKTLIDNIFSNDPNFSQGVSGNFTFSISDHLPQFLLMPKEVSRTPKKHNMYKRSKNFDKEEIVSEFVNLNWQDILSIEKMDPTHSLQNFDAKINEIIDKHIPLKKLSKKDFKLKEKP